MHRVVLLRSQQIFFRKLGFIQMSIRA
jgi:hypothetical protein